jgi:hypothetical protein
MNAIPFRRTGQAMANVHPEDAERYRVNRLSWLAPESRRSKLSHRHEFDCPREAWMQDMLKIYPVVDFAGHVLTRLRRLPADRIEKRPIGRPRDRLAPQHSR